MLEIEVAEVRGYSPSYGVGDRIVADDPEIVFSNLMRELARQRR